MKNKPLTIGIAGTLVTAVCCFTPLLVWLLPIFGLSAIIGYLDLVLIPALVIFLFITGYALLVPSPKIRLESTITCPECGHCETEAMPTNACQWFYDCKGCGAVLMPKDGDCCVFCSYATVPCPPIQEGKACG